MLHASYNQTSISLFQTFCFLKWPPSSSPQPRMRERKHSFLTTEQGYWASHWCEFGQVTTPEPTPVARGIWYPAWPPLKSGLPYRKPYVEMVEEMRVPWGKSNTVIEKGTMPGFSNVQFKFYFPCDIFPSYIIQKDAVGSLSRFPLMVSKLSPQLL